MVTVCILKKLLFVTVLSWLHFLDLQQFGGLAIMYDIDVWSTIVNTTIVDI